jgi:hypothetical protein
VAKLTRALRLATGMRVDAGQSVTPLPPRMEERRRWRETEGDADWTVAP